MARGGRSFRPASLRPAPDRREPCGELPQPAGALLHPARAITALQGLSLDVAAGEFLTLLGPSGCGKSTFLRVVADLIQPNAGEISRLRRRTRGRASAARHRLRVPGRRRCCPGAPRWPTSSCRCEVAVARAPCQGDAARAARAGRAEGQRTAYPHELSGGMRQRVAIARALAGDPKILLMDEPFGALDEITRDRLNEELRRVWRELGMTVLFVTHSIHEAAYLGQRVLMMAANPGRVRDIVAVDLPPTARWPRATRPVRRAGGQLRRLLETC